MAPRVTNAQLMDKLIVIDERTKHIDARAQKLELATFGDGNGTKGLVRRQDEDERNWQTLFKSLKIAGGLIMLIVSALIAALTNHAFASWEASARIESRIASLSEAMVTAARPTPTADGNRPPSPPVGRAQSYSSVVSVPADLPTTTVQPEPLFDVDEKEWLARLCVVEARGMVGARDEACLSIISTVLSRIAHRRITDGTIRGTLTYGCGPETIACQFPAYAVNGCEGISATACPLNYPESLAHFRAVVERYEAGMPAPCAGYLFYGIQHFDRPECVVRSENGQYLNFWGKTDE